MEKNNSSNSPVCRKIRQALGSIPALRAIHRISSYHHEPKPVNTSSNSPSSSPANTAIQTKPPLLQNHKVNTEGSGEIPIKFDYSNPTTTTMENGNSAVSRVHGQAPKVASPLDGNSERATKVAAKVEAQPQPQHIGRGGGQGAKADAFKGVHSKAPGTLGAQHGHGVHSEQQGKKSADINDTFYEYIKIVKDKLRTVSNIGRGQNNPAPDDHEDHGTNKKESHRDQFSDFIHGAKKKFRTRTIVGKTSSMKRG